MKLNYNDQMSFYDFTIANISFPCQTLKDFWQRKKGIK